MSSKTLHKSLEYIRTHRPVCGSAPQRSLRWLKSLSITRSQAYVVLENVAKRGTDVLLSRELTQLSYTVQGYLINSAAFGVPQSRSRLYMLAVDPLQLDVLHGPEQWTVWLPLRLAK